jgi:hypothetical protein
MIAYVNEKLAQFLNEGKNWEKSIISSHRENTATSSATKRRDIIIRSGSEIEL